jgi:hypothetical protein
MVPVLNGSTGLWIERCGFAPVRPQARSPLQLKGFCATQNRYLRTYFAVIIDDNQTIAESSATGTSA